MKPLYLLILVFCILSCEQKPISPLEKSINSELSEYEKLTLSKNDTMKYVLGVVSTVMDFLTEEEAKNWSDITFDRLYNYHNFSLDFTIPQSSIREWEQKTGLFLDSLRSTEEFESYAQFTRPIFRNAFKQKDRKCHAFYALHQDIKNKEFYDSFN